MLLTFFFSFYEVHFTTYKDVKKKMTVSILVKIIFTNLFYYLTYFYYYLWVTLHFLVLFMGLTVLFQLTFTFNKSMKEKAKKWERENFVFQYLHYPNSCCLNCCPSGCEVPKGKPIVAMPLPKMGGKGKKKKKGCRNLGRN